MFEGDIPAPHWHTPLHVVPGTTFLVRRPDTIDATLDGRTTTIGKAAFEILCRFIEARAPAEAFDGRSPSENDSAGREAGAAATVEHETGLGSSRQGESNGLAFCRVLDDLLRKGLLEKKRPAELSSLFDLLNPSLQDPEFLAHVGRLIADNRAVVLPNAVQAEMAGELHRALDTSRAWSIHSYFNEERPYFQFKHCGLYDSATPPELRKLGCILDSTATKSQLSDITGCDCRGTFQIGAAGYNSGDYSFPHNDDGGLRSVSFLWYLSKGWRPEWGGQFVWCPTGAMITPEYNTIVLFKVSPSSLHFVTQVSHNARDRRLAIVGFWERSQQTADGRPRAINLNGINLCPGVYGSPTDAVDGRAVIL